MHRGLPCAAAPTHHLHPCLQRDFGLYLVNMFDTGQAARLLCYPSASLAYLLERHCGFKPDKRWAGGRRVCCSCWPCMHRGCDAVWVSLLQGQAVRLCMRYLLPAGVCSAFAACNNIYDIYI
jgi:hypothetical protein